MMKMIEEEEMMRVVQAVLLQLKAYEEEFSILPQKGHVFHVSQPWKAQGDVAMAEAVLERIRKGREEIAQMVISKDLCVDFFPKKMQVCHQIRSLLVAQDDQGLFHCGGCLSDLFDLLC